MRERDRQMLRKLRKRGRRVYTVVERGRRLSLSNASRFLSLAPSLSLIFGPLGLLFVCEFLAPFCSLFSRPTHLFLFSFIPFSFLFLAHSSLRYIYLRIFVHDLHDRIWAYIHPCFSRLYAPHNAPGHHFAFLGFYVCVSLYWLTRKSRGRNGIYLPFRVRNFLSRFYIHVPVVWTIFSSTRRLSHLCKLLTWINFPLCFKSLIDYSLTCIQSNLKLSVQFEGAGQMWTKNVRLMASVGQIPYNLLNHLVLWNFHQRDFLPSISYLRESRLTISPRRTGSRFPPLFG